MRFVGLVVCGAVVVALAACIGIIGTPPGEVDLPDPPSTVSGGAVAQFACKPGLSAAVQVPVRRLTTSEYKHTVHDLFERYTVPAPALVSIVESALGALPDDRATPALNAVTPGSSFESLSVDVTRGHNDAFFVAAMTLGTEIASNEQIRGALLGECAIDTDAGNDKACIASFIREFGAIAHRRPLTDTAQQFYLDVVYADLGNDTSSPDNPYAIRGDAVRDLVIALLTSPNFLYHLALDGDDVTSDSFALDSYARAARLSYFVWNTMPDAELRAAAARGELLTDAGYLAQVQRLFAHPRARDVLHDFIQQWLELERVADASILPSVGDPVFLAFAGESKPTRNLRFALIREVLDSFDYYFDNEGSFADFFTSDLSFAGSAELAALYGTEVWTKGSTEGPPQFQDAARHGLIARGAFLTQQTPTTRPIVRGAFIRRRILCDTLDPPPADVSADIKDEPLSGNMTTREHTASLTEVGVCAGCHAAINGLGFPLEEFDALGRLRTTERIFDASGALVADLKINTSALPTIDRESSNVRVQDASELVDALSQSGYVEACFVRNYLRSAIGRLEDIGEDACALEELRVAAKNKSLRGFFETLVTSDAFLQQRVGG